MTEDAGRLVDESPEAADRPWASLFPHDPYPQQVDGIDTLLDVLADNGWLAMEGACGTGKTLVALVAGVYAVRNDAVTLPDRDAPVAIPAYDRVLAVTPVKQQLAQFVTEVRRMNEQGTTPPVDGLVLRGLADTLAYARADDFALDDAWGRTEGPRAGTLDDLTADAGVDDAPPFGEMVDVLRETTVDLVAAGSPVTLRWDGPGPGTCAVEECGRLTRPDSTAPRCPFHRDADDDAEGPWYDIVRARRVAALATADGERPLRVHGVETPYPDRLVRVVDVADPRQELLATDWDAPLDPFYARSVADTPPVSFADGRANVLDRDDLVPPTAGAGHCPHRTMGALVEDAEVVVGNYMHLYDPDTRRLTGDRGDALDERTVAVVDEAHRVEERARDVRSASVSIYTLVRSATDVERATRVLRGEGLGSATGDAAERAARRAREVAAEVGRTRGDGSVTARDLETARQFHDWLLDWIGDRVRDHDGAADPGEGVVEVALAPPGERATDELTRAVERGESPVDGRDGLERVAVACTAAGAIHDAVHVSDRTPVADDVGAFLADWATADPVAYFRELRVERSPHETPPLALPDWADRLTAHLSLYNCIPAGPVGSVHAELGGGVAMSATLEPMDVYTEATGLAALADGVPGDPLADPDVGRRVETARYPLAFPPENRVTWGVPLDRFTHRNRGDPTTDHAAMSDTRAQYARVIRVVANSHGNVLLCLPNYREAEWAADLLADIDKPVHLDRSTASDATTRLLESFFDPADNAVLVTSTLGTVTEGVDYEGDRLHTACVIGVPYRNTNTPRMEAVREAYDATFGNDDRTGFEMAVAVPAVRKARQAIGRVIRGPDERGVRLFVDERYLSRGEYDVGQHLADEEFAELEAVGPEMLEYGLEKFWDEG